MLPYLVNEFVWALRYMGSTTGHRFRLFMHSAHVPTCARTGSPQHFRLSWGTALLVPLDFSFPTFRVNEDAVLNPTSASLQLLTRDSSLHGHRMESRPQTYFL